MLFFAFLLGCSMQWIELIVSVRSFLIIAGHLYQCFDFPVMAMYLLSVKYTSSPGHLIDQNFVG